MQTLQQSFSDKPVSREWRARWIGPSLEPNAGTRALFRREFSIDTTEGCRLFISAERDYQLFVNGEFVCRGVPPSPYYYKYYDEVDLSERLTAGKNCIAVLVSQIGAPEAALLAELVGANDELLLASDDSWRVTARTGWSVVDSREGVTNTNFQEFFDAGRHPEGWKQPGFDDSGWLPPNLYPPLGSRACPWARMVPRRIPQLAEWDVLPEAVTVTEEGLDILSRHRNESLSVQLSATGKPVEFSRLENPEALCREDGETVLQVSTEHHRDRAFDGIYAPSVVLDFGKVITGYLTIELEGAGGGRLDVGYAERLLNGHFNNAIEVHYADRYVMKDGPQRFTSTVWKGFRYVKLRMTNTEQPVRIKSVKTRICTYDYDERGAFESGDDTLNKVFDICRYTIRLCSRDFLMDTPWRERNQWLGDNSAVTLPGIYACFGDIAMPRQFLDQAMATPLPIGILVNNSQGYDPIGSAARKRLSNEIPDYSLWWIQAIWEHYQITGDDRLVHAAYPHVVTILDFHWRFMNEYGLVGNMPVWEFIDHVFKPPARITAAYNALWYGTLEYALELSKMIGDARTAEKIEGSREIIEQNFKDAFFDSKLGLYRDGFVDGAPGAGISEHSNLTAICYGLADEEQTREILSRLYEKRDIEFLECEPFFCVVVLKALRKARRIDLALDLIRERWGKRMVDLGMTSLVEEWNASASWRGPGVSYSGIYRSLSHAWSGCPAEFLIRQLTGFEIIEPGCKRIRLEPYKADFDYCTTIPTPRGDIGVQWQGGKLTVDAPAGITLEP